MTPSHTVLLVDDYPDALDAWELYLRAEGFTVLTALDGEAALAEAIRGRPHVIVLDLELPTLSGVEVAARLKQSPDTKHIPLIAATGYSYYKQLDLARAAGFDAVLVKPVDPRALSGEIKRLLGEIPPAGP